MTVAARTVSAMHRGWLVTAALMLLCMLTPAQAAECVAATDPQRSEAALKALTELGADLRQRDVGGRPQVMLSTDGNWRGGDAGLDHLKDVIGLYKLRLAGEISDAGLAQLAGVCGLTGLDLHLIGLTDVGVHELRHLTRLERLNLTYTKVSDAGLESLAGLRQLRWLGLSYTQVTRAGIDKLKRSLDKTIIEGNPSS